MYSAQYSFSSFKNFVHFVSTILNCERDQRLTFSRQNVSCTPCTDYTARSVSPQTIQHYGTFDSFDCSACLLITKVGVFVLRCKDAEYPER